MTLEELFLTLQFLECTLVSMHISVDVNAFVILETALLAMSSIIIIYESDVHSLVICCAK